MLGFFLRVALVIALWAAPAPLAQVLAASGGMGAVLRIEQDKGQIVKLPQAAASVYVANPEIVDLQVMSPTMVYLFAKKSGETTLIAVTADQTVVINRPVQVIPNLSGLDRALKERFPNRALATQAAGGAVVLKGTVASPAEAEDARRIAQRYAGPDAGDIQNRLNVAGGTQVMLRVRVSEVTRTIREDLGINWNALGRFGTMSVGLVTGITDVPALAAAPIARAGADPTTMDLFGHYSSSRWDINGLVDALARDGLITVLAEPNLVASSGETASFLAGGEFPIPIPQGNGTISIEFKQFGVSLAFVPTVLSGERISLRVRPEVSELDYTNAITLTSGIASASSFRVPALRTRRAETTIELGSGQSFAIAGLLQNGLDESLNKFPGLGDVPVLGALFRSSRYQRAESELVIIVTPYLVRPAAGPNRLGAPTDGLAPANFVDRLLRGRLTQPGAGALPVARATLSGPVGYIVE